MNYANKLLSSDEHIVLVARDHWIVLLLAVLVDLAVSIVIVGLVVLGVLLAPPWTWLGLLLLIAPLAHLALRIWNWWNRQYIITDLRLIQITGAFNKRVSDTLLAKINDIVMEQSALGRMLNFGSVEVISGSESGIDIFRRIADPIGFKKALLTQKDSPGRAAPKELGGDVTDLIAELDELRQKGSITATEFEAKKQQLLDRI